MRTVTNAELALRSSPLRFLSVVFRSDHPCRPETQETERSFSGCAADKSVHGLGILCHGQPATFRCPCSTADLPARHCAGVRAVQLTSSQLETVTALTRGGAVVTPRAAAQQRRDTRAAVAASILGLAVYFTARTVANRARILPQSRWIGAENCPRTGNIGANAQC